MENKVPHVLLLPFPAQGHINSMINLAQLLCLAGFHVTFLNTDHNHDRLLRFTDIQSRFSPWPGFRFRTISDGLPVGHPRSADRFMELVDSLRTHMKPLFREMLISNRRELDAVTFIVADGIMMFATDVADEVGIPILTFRTISACSFWSYFCIPGLAENGELPFPDGDMNGLIKGVPGMETFLRRRDLPSFLRVKELNIPSLQFIWTETQNTTRSAGLILNTFEDLESPILSQIRSHCPNIYTVGPLHALLKSKLSNNNNSSSSSSSLWKEDNTCMTWLDSKPPKSVIYVSFGSYATVTRDEMLEFWHGLVNSQKSFLWVIRPDSITGKGEEGQIPAELEEGTRKRGFLVEWAPQVEVLAHPAVAAFLTHSGWNSTVESVFAGVPMICWPFFADQQINSRFVSEVWRDGLDMKDLSCSRETVEKLVREVMEGKREELRTSSNKIAEFARQSVGVGGSSWNNLERLIEDIRSMSFPLH
ncbi:7-deoxyloganetic acid glucosyltransferase-like isoform X1 [Tasmannia lanceolata]|uniref:7-deoxyloganetic acid glucosyltransferase-like isoform X1 n=1 Tax=Tasmannia lanceolata TaxID=3420 RepID=UPI0040638E77